MGNASRQQPERLEALRALQAFTQCTLLCACPVPFGHIPDMGNPHNPALTDHAPLPDLDRDRAGVAAVGDLVRGTGGHGAGGSAPIDGPSRVKVCHRHPRQVGRIFA